MDVIIIGLTVIIRIIIIIIKCPDMNPNAEYQKTE